MTTEAATLSSTRKESGALHVALWVTQVVLFLAFTMGGLMKAALPLDQLAAKMPWVPAVPAGLVRFIGISELSGGLGMLLPSLTRMRPRLTALAGVGLVLVMVLAAGLHMSRGEWGVLPINAFFGGLAAFVAWGRGRRLPIAPRE